MSRIDALLGAMTLTEKLGQLTMTAANYAVTGPVIAGDASEAIRKGEVGNLLNIYGPERVRDAQRLAVEESRLGVPLLVGLDVVHGHRTMFPTPLAESCALDPTLWERTAREAATEAAADGVSLVFAPMIDISRDPRWGRTVEGAGEDPFVARLFAEAKVRGFQTGDLARSDSAAATAKHFVAYGPVTAGREYASVDISDRTLREVHLPSFRAAVSAGVAVVMPAFTDLAGVPMTANEALLTDELRGRLGFDGLIVSDYNAVAELIRHGVAADLVEAAALALRAGVDIDMMADAYRRGLPDALARGLVDMAQIDRAVRRVLRLKEQLGLFDDPYRRGARVESAEALTARRAVAREAATRSLVLLKNDGGVLPLSRSAQRIAVIGPLADAGPQMRGPWWAAAQETGHIAPLEGLREALPHAEIVFVEGTSIADGDLDGVAAAVRAVAGCEAAILCLGEAATGSGEAASRVDPGLPGRQEALADTVFAAASECGAPVIAILFGGRPLIAPALFERAQAVISAGFLGSEAGRGLADALLGRRSPSGRTTISWPRSVGQIPIFYAERPSGRPENPDDHFTSKYADSPNDPQFPFGWGLTYGRFVLSNLRVGPPELRADGALEIEVDLTNEGEAEAEETVFCFVRDPVASVARPVLELKAFAKATLAPGETRVVRMSVSAIDLMFLGRDLTSIFEPGDLEILVGPCADRRRLLSAAVRLV